MIATSVVMLWCFVSGIFTHAVFLRNKHRKLSECDKAIIGCLDRIDKGERWAPPTSGFKVIGQTEISRGANRYLIQVDRIEG